MALMGGAARANGAAPFQSIGSFDAIELRFTAPFVLDYGRMMTPEIMRDVSCYYTVDQIIPEEASLLISALKSDVAPGQPGSADPHYYGDAELNIRIIFKRAGQVTGGLRVVGSPLSGTGTLNGFAVTTTPTLWRDLHHWLFVVGAWGQPGGSAPTCPKLE
jgi:hypothetical protein